jgi:diguanylate cyclase (GGDEF)-like protein
MTIGLEQLAEVAAELQGVTVLDRQLQLLVDKTAEILKVPRAGVRLLDSTRGRLLAVARAGEPLHRLPLTDFALGEGLLGWVAEHQQPVLVDDAEQDPRFVRRPGMTEHLGSLVAVPLVVRGSCIGVLYVSHRDRGVFDAEHQNALTLLAGLCGPHIEAARLERLSEIDALTGVLNRRGMPGVLDDRSPASVVLIDIDHFKNINDQLGHSAGDHVLCRVATLLSGVLRGGDAVVRWGGEEFLLVLPGVDVEKAFHVAERARKAVSQEAFGPRSDLHVTVSAGVAERRGAELAEQLIRRADEALYAAKQQGRDRTCRASTT